MIFFLISCAFVSDDEFQKRLDPDNDGITENDCDAANPSVGAPRDWFLDSDGDGYGAPNQVETACTSPGE